MKKPALLVTVVFLFPMALGVHPAEVSAVDDHKAVIMDLLETIKDISDVFDTIRDADSAATAKPKLDKLADKLEAIAKRAKKLEKPDPEKDKALKKEFAEPLRTTLQRFVASAQEVGKIPEVRPVLKDFGKRLQQIGQAMKAIGQ